MKRFLRRLPSPAGVPGAAASLPRMADATVLYDADCGFCRSSLALILTWDRNGRLRPVALQDPEADRLLANLSPDQRMGSWHLVTPDGKVRSAGDALEVLFTLLPGGSPPSALARRFPRVARSGYRWVADHRSQLGRIIPPVVRRRADASVRRRG